MPSYSFGIDCIPKKAQAVKKMNFQSYLVLVLEFHCALDHEHVFPIFEGNFALSRSSVTFFRTRCPCLVLFRSRLRLGSRSGGTITARWRCRCGSTSRRHSSRRHSSRRHCRRGCRGAARTGSAWRLTIGASTAAPSDRRVREIARLVSLFELFRESAGVHGLHYHACSIDICEFP